LWGTLPTELGLLSQLSSLYVSSNQLNGTIPIELSQLPGLQYLLLDDNAFTGSVNAPFCADESEWVDFESDCLATDGEVEIECVCCTRCCNVNATDCHEMT